MATKKIPKNANGPNNHHAKFELHLTYRWFYENLWNLQSSHRFALGLATQDTNHICYNRIFPGTDDINICNKTVVYSHFYHIVRAWHHTRWPVCMYLEIDASTVIYVVVHRQSICLLKVQIRKVHNACLCTCSCVKLTVREILQCTCFNNFQNNWFNVCLGKFVFIRSGNIKIIWTRMDFCDALVSITVTMIKSIYIYTCINQSFHDFLSVEV